MSFTVIPAVDIRGGRCVRLHQGRPDEETVFSEDPVATAAMWRDQGASLLHVVDLDGAFGGTPANMRSVTAIARELDIPVEVGGGIRDTATAMAYLDAGLARVVVGTAAFERPGWLEPLARELGERLVVGLDTRDGAVSVSGWTEKAGIGALEALGRLESAGVRRVIFTEASTDGTLAGPPVAAIEEVARATQIPVIAAGGVAGLGDIRLVAGLEPLGVEGVIVGMALYRKRFTLARAIEAGEGGGA